MLLGESATFSCAGEDVFTIAWNIDGDSAEDLGFEPTNDVVAKVRMSNLTITGTVEYNNASIQCVMFFLTSPKISLAPVFLTVLGKP